MTPLLLEEAMQYQNPEVLERYKDKLGLSGAEAEELFNDVKRFLYLCASAPGPKAPTSRIDDGWHEFMMYSKEYREFCLRSLGQIIDHYPRSYLHPAGENGTLVRSTTELAAKMFGDLGINWVPRDSESPCDGCGNSGCTWIAPKHSEQVSTHREHVSRIGLQAVS